MLAYHDTAWRVVDAVQSKDYGPRYSLSAVRSVMCSLTERLVAELNLVDSDFVDNPSERITDPLTFAGLGGFKLGQTAEQLSADGWVRPQMQRCGVNMPANKVTDSGVSLDVRRGVLESIAVFRPRMARLPLTRAPAPA